MSLDRTLLCTFETEYFDTSKEQSRQIQLYSPASITNSYEAKMVKYCAEAVSNRGTFLDIGAHLGFYSLPLSGRFDKCIAFEPSDFQFELLTKNIELNNIKNVIPLKLGLGATEEEKVFYVTGNSGGTNTLLKNKFSESPMSTYKIQVRALDSFGYSNVNLIKIDVEGWEVEVLKGSLETIHKSSPYILIEVWEEPDRRREVEQLLDKLNYEIKYCFTDFPELGWASKRIKGN